MPEDEKEDETTRYDIWDVTQYKLRKRQKERRAENEEA